MHDRRGTGHEECTTGGVQDTMNAGQEECTMYSENADKLSFCVEKLQINYPSV